MRCWPGRRAGSGRSNARRCTGSPPRPAGSRRRGCARTACRRRRWPACANAAWWRSIPGGSNATLSRPGASAEAEARDGGAAVEATPEQRVALETLGALAAARVFHVALLHGVTGSGKTEVYLRLARQVVADGRRVLVLVPEIALTPSVTETFRGAFGDRVAIQHSGLSPGARHDQWHRARRGEIAVVVGTRSAVFAPLDALGLVVVDEEHDTSYKQEDSPRYHARNVAIVRARRAGALVVLGSATPSLETFHHARNGR